MSDLETKWEAAIKSDTREVRGFVGHKGQGGVEVKLRGSRRFDGGMGWAFEIVTTIGLRASSDRIFYTEADARAAATHMAIAVLMCPRGER